MYIHLFVKENKTEQLNVDGQIAINYNYNVTKTDSPYKVEVN